VEDINKKTGSKFDTSKADDRVVVESRPVTEDIPEPEDTSGLVRYEGSPMKKRDSGMKVPQNSSKEDLSIGGFKLIPSHIPIAENS
jgi:hypothetical protein